MIYLLDRERRAYDDLVICIGEIPTLNQVLGSANIMVRSFSYRLITSVYEDIFLYSLDLKEDYERFFSKEYKDFEKYLRKRHRMIPDLSRSLAKHFASSKKILLVRNLPILFDSEYGRKLLAEILPKGVLDEN